jgi:hypothetical protein
MRNATLALAAAGLLLSPAMAPAAKAAVGHLDDQRMPVTVTEPLQIPGQELPAGTYWLTLRHPETDANTVVIYAADQITQVATVETAPTERPSFAGSRVILGQPRSTDANTNSHQVLLAWFVRGENVGHEFLYAPADHTNLNINRQVNTWIDTQ